LVLMGALGVSVATTVVGTVAVGTTPRAVGVNPSSNKIYVPNYNSTSVSVISGTSNLVVATPAVGTYPYAVGVNSNTNKIYVPNFGSDTVSVIDGGDDTVLATPAVGSYPCAVGVNTSSNKIYVANRSSSSVSVIDGGSNTVWTTVNVGTNPCDVGVNPTTNRIYVANFGSDTVSVINGGDDTVLATPAVGSYPYAVGVNTSSNKIYVANRNSSNVSVIDGETNGVTTVTVGASPWAVGVNPTTNKVYVPNNGSNSVSVIYYLTITSLSPSSATAGDPAFTLTVNGTGFVSGLSVVRWNGSDRTTTYVSATQLTAAIPASDIAAAGTASVTVFNSGPGGGESNAQTFTINPYVPPPTRIVSSTWYLAEGTTSWGFSTYITIQNPNASNLSANVTYMPTGAANKTETVNLPANSQTTLTNDHLVSVMGGAADFSTKVECTDATKSIAVDRTMTWTGTGAASEEAHSSVGVTSPAATWYLAEGSSAWGFECWLLIQNPNPATANVTLNYMIEGEGLKSVSHQVEANSRATFEMSKDIGNKDASVQVVSDQNVIPERAMYRNNRREGHDSIGTTAPASDYYLAEGTTDYGFTTYVLIQNPQSTPVDATITYMTPGGPKPQGAFSMPANSRKTIRVNDIPEVSKTDFSTQVHGSAPIIAERAMYWSKGKGEACHDSIGMDSPHTTFYLPDGQSSSGRETYTLVQNPNSSDVSVDISYLTPDGSGNVKKTETIAANSRCTFGMAEHSGISGRAAIQVVSTTSGKKIMVERAMYWNSMGAGTDTIGGYGD